MHAERAAHAGRAQGLPSGRLLSYSPATRETHVVAEGFWFANGVALAADEAFAAVVSSNSARVYRVWLAGAKVGSPVIMQVLSQIADLVHSIWRAYTGCGWPAPRYAPLASCGHVAGRHQGGRWVLIMPQPSPCHLHNAFVHAPQKC